MSERLSSQPANERAERAVLGCVFLENSSFHLISEQLHEEDFYFPKNRLVYAAMLALSAQAKPIDYQTIEEQLRKDDTFDKVGGTDYLLEINEGAFYRANLPSYIEIVKEKAALRALNILGNDLCQRASIGSESSAAILEAAEQTLMQINNHQINGGLVAIRQTVGETLARISERSLSEGQLTGLSTGFRALDEQLSGFQKSDLILLAARPSMGKTALGVNMGFNVARSRDENGEFSHRVAIFSLEMSKVQLTQRLLAMASGINLQKIISGNIEDWDQLLASAELLNQLPLYIDDTSSISIQELRAKCRRMKMEGGLDMVVIDYLQLMTVDDVRRSENRQQEISTISRGLKALAKEMDCPVLALSQLSRKTESRGDARPIMSDMRESGAIEQDADVVMLLYREDYYDAETEQQNLTEVNIAKHRNGPTGMVKLYFIKELTKFGDVSYADDPQY
ncbi:MAG: replicative DNA helicase [Ndongobacter sp.]|nr:replicative DNA helicase [Ndongobacter sp.]